MKNKDNLRIAFVQWVLPLYRLGFYKELSKLNTSYFFTILCPQGEDHATNIKTITPEQFNAATNNTDKIKWINTKVIYYYKGEVLWETGIIMRLLRKEFDVLMISNKMSHLFYWLLVFISKLCNIKLIFWSHGLQGNEKGFKLWLKKWYLNFPDVNLVYANYNKKLQTELGFKPGKIQVVYNSLDMEEQDENYTRIRQEDKKEIKKRYVNNNYSTLLFVGRLEKRKRVDMVLEAAQILKQRGLNLNIIIIGEGSELEGLKELTTQLGLMDNVYFMGRIYEEKELVKFFYIADLFVSPGHVGLNCMHSLNYGLPLITHNNYKHQGPEAEILIDNETGLFIKEDDVLDLANKIGYWLSKHSSNDVSEKLRKLVRDKYSPAIQAQSVLDGISLL